MAGASPPDHPARVAAEQAARASYGKLVAILASRSRDLAAAEDALAGAFAKALETWPAGGVPKSPEAWLLTAARRTMLNAHRHDRVRDAAAPEVARRYDERLGEIESVQDGMAALPDERLKLLFVCAHPAIDPAARTPLMLQTVLGLDAARIGAAFLVAPATMGQRLVRAKVKIRDAGIHFDVPGIEVLPDRLGDVLDAIYAAFGAGWDASAESGETIRGLPEEAIYLARLLASLLPDEPETMGLLSLMLFVHARRRARRDAAGSFVPLGRQDVSLWDRDAIIEAEGRLTAASRHGRFGRFQCEAAIQSVHAQRAVTGRLNLDALETLYGLLARHHPSIGALVAWAAVLHERGDPAAALARLDAITPVPEGYQPYWVLRAHCLRELGDAAGARLATEEAITLTPDAAVRTYLLGTFAPLGLM